MKRFNFLFQGLSVLLFLSCNTQEHDFAGSNSFPSDGIIRVTTESGAFTRGGHIGATLESFRLFVINPSSTLYTYEDVEMRKVGNLFESYKDNEPLTMWWQNSAASVNVVAMTTAMEKLEEAMTVFVKSDQTSDQFIQQSDFLYYKKDDFVPEADLMDSKIPVRFTHKCAQFSLTLNLTSVLSSSDANPLAEVSIHGVYLSREFNPVAGTWGTTFGQTVSYISPNPVSYSSDSLTAVYECIIIPQTVSANGLSIRFKLNGVDYNYALPQETVFKEGVSHTLTINVTN